MSKRLYFIEIQGNEHQWNFDVWIDPKFVDEWREDGIKIFEIINTIPASVQHAGFGRAWVFFQDLFYWRNPFKKESK